MVMRDQVQFDEFGNIRLKKHRECNIDGAKKSTPIKYSEALARMEGK